MESHFEAVRPVQKPYLHRRKSRPCLTGTAFELVPEVGLEPTSLAAEDFLPTSAFAAVLHGAGRSWSGARLHHSLSTVGARRLLSTPSHTFRLGLGSALARTCVQGLHRV